MEVHAMCESRACILVVAFWLLLVLLVISPYPTEAEAAAQRTVNAASQRFTLECALTTDAYDPQTGAPSAFRGWYGHGTKIFNFELGQTSQYYDFDGAQWITLDAVTTDGVVMDKGMGSKKSLAWKHQPSTGKYQEAMGLAITNGTCEKAAWKSPGRAKF
jgi:hypothetical protein